MLDAPRLLACRACDAEPASKADALRVPDRSRPDVWAKSRPVAEMRADAPLEKSRPDAPPVPVPDDAPLQVKLLAIFGRAA